MEVEVKLFGKPVLAVRDGSQVMFERASFMRAISKPRAQRIFKELEERLAFLGPDGPDALIAEGKEHMICALLLSSSDTSDELREYASAWVTAFEMLAEAK